jgi:hypothetical protein
MEKYRHKRIDFTTNGVKVMPAGITFENGLHIVVPDTFYLARLKSAGLTKLWLN